MTLKSVIRQSQSPVYYTAGIYGKNADVFCEGDAVIARGYRPFGKAVVIAWIKEEFEEV